MMIDQFEREKRYQTMLVITRKMLDEGIISKKEFARVEHFLNKKYNPLIRAEMT